MSIVDLHTIKPDICANFATDLHVNVSNRFMLQKDWITKNIAFVEFLKLEKKLSPSILQNFEFTKEVKQELSEGSFLISSYVTYFTLL